MKTINNTPFEFAAIPNYDKEGLEVLTTIVKATYSLPDNTSIQIADEQEPLVMADEYWGKPGESPMKYEADIAVFKPAADLILLGSARHYDGKPINKAEVTFGIGSVKKKKKVKSSEPLEKIPLYLLEDFWTPKTIFRTNHKGDGFGFFPKQYKPRVKYAGTYDKNWRAKRAPFLPQNFDYRFFQSAYPDLITKSYLYGNEQLSAQNVSANGPIQFNLPGISLEVECFFEKSSIKENLMLDTVILKADESRLLLIWRKMVPCHGMIQQISGFQVNMFLDH